MSKEWKCTDCVKYKTDACSTCACGYTPTVSCRDVLVDFDYAYHQGRADAIDEFDRICEEARGHKFGVCDADFVIDVIKAKVKEQLKEQKN